jgi:NADH-quinone oxidoreductase subunit M
MLGSIGLPGTSGFIGEFFSILGIFSASNLVAIVAAIGIVLGATYMLKLYKKVMFGEITNESVLSFEDLKAYEISALLPLAILIICLGLFPDIIMKTIDLSIYNLVRIYDLTP